MLQGEDSAFLTEDDQTFLSLNTGHQMAYLYCTRTTSIMISLYRVRYEQLFPLNVQHELEIIVEPIASSAMHTTYRFIL